MGGADGSGFGVVVFFSSVVVERSVVEGGADGVLEDGGGFTTVVGGVCWQPTSRKLNNAPPRIAVLRSLNVFTGMSPFLLGNSVAIRLPRSVCLTGAGRK